MSRYEVAFSARALESPRQVTRYIAEETGTSRATAWLAEVRASAVTLETHPYAFRVVGEFEGVRIRARPIMRHVLYYFVDESANAVTVVDVVHSARDAWQNPARPAIRETNLGPTPIALDRLDGQGWADALRGARECLDPRKQHRGVAAVRT